MAWYKSKRKNQKPLVKTKIPKEIWDAEHSIFNILFMRKNILRAWMNSVEEVIERTNKLNKK